MLKWQSDRRDAHAFLNAGERRSANARTANPPNREPVDGRASKWGAPFFCHSRVIALWGRYARQYVSNLRSRHVIEQSSASGPGRLCASHANSQPVRHLSPRALVRLAAGLALASSTSRRRRRSRRRRGSAVRGFGPRAVRHRCRFPASPSSAVGADGAEIASTSSEQNGSYVLRLRGPGTYTIRASLAAFAPATREATLAAGDCSSRLDLVAGPRVARRGSRRRLRLRRQPATSTPARQLRQAACDTAQGRLARERRPRLAGPQGAAGFSSSTSSPTRPASRRHRSRR